MAGCLVSLTPAPKHQNILLLSQAKKSPPDFKNSLLRDAVTHARRRRCQKPGNIELNRTISGSDKGHGDREGSDGQDRQVTWAGVVTKASLRGAPGAGAERARCGRRLSRAEGAACAKALGQDHTRCAEGAARPVHSPCRVTPDKPHALGAAFPSANRASRGRVAVDSSPPPHPSPEHGPLHASAFCLPPTAFHLLGSNFLPIPFETLQLPLSDGSDSPSPSAPCPWRPLTARPLSPWTRLFWTCPVSGITRRVAFRVWRLSLSVLRSRRVHVVAGVSASPLLRAE